MGAPGGHYIDDADGAVAQKVRLQPKQSSSEDNVANGSVVGQAMHQVDDAHDNVASEHSSKSVIQPTDLNPGITPGTVSESNGSVIGHESQDEQIILRCKLVETKQKTSPTRSELESHVDKKPRLLHYAMEAAQDDSDGVFVQGTQVLRTTAAPSQTLTLPKGLSVHVPTIAPMECLA